MRCANWSVRRAGVQCLVGILLAVFATACGATAPTPTLFPPTVPLPAGATGVPTRPASKVASATGPAPMPVTADTTASPVARATEPTAASTATGTTIPATAPVVPAAGTPIPSPSAPAILYRADFANWFIGQEGGEYPLRASLDPATGEYRLALTGPQRGYGNYRTIPDERRFTDFQLDVDLRKIAGPDNAVYGVVFRVQPAIPGARTYQRYGFVVTGNGAYTVSLVNPDGPATVIAPRGTSPAIARGNGSNHLTVTCRGSQITVAVNGEILGTFTGPVVAPGTAGVYIGELSTTSTEPLLEVAFSNLVVSEAP